MTTSISEKLTELLGSDALLSPPLLEGYSVDGIVPQAVVQPASREAIAEVLRWAASEKLAVIPRGGGTQLSLGNPPHRADLVLDLGRCNRLLDYEPADLTATVEAGITLEALRLELSQGGKLAPLEAPLAQKATIGGILATNASGPLRYTYGLARDWLIGVSVITPNGVETRAGGKVVKNVTGYDLNKLYTGSLGTLGVIVEATFKLTPVATDSGALIAVFPSLQAGIDSCRELLRQVYAPQGIHVANAPAAERLGMPLSLSEDESAVLAFFSGRPRAVQRRMDESGKSLESSGARGLERMEERAGSGLLNRLTDFGWTTDTAPQLGLKVSLPPSAAGQMAARRQDEQPSGPLPGIVADPGFGQVQFLWWDGPAGPGLEDSTIIATIEKMRERAGTLGGTVIVEHCPPSVKQQVDVWGDSSELIELMTRVKQGFDPAGILNPGRFMGRL